MPPHSDATQRRTAEELLNSISRYASAIVRAGSSGDLASLPPGLKLSELFRHLRELSDLLNDDGSVRALVATNISPQGRVALAQLYAGALRLAFDPWDQQPPGAAAAAARPGPDPKPAATAAMTSTDDAAGAAAISNADDRHLTDTNLEGAFTLLVYISGVTSSYIRSLISERGPRAWDQHNGRFQSPGPDLKLQLVVATKTEALPALSRLLSAMAPAEGGGSRRRPIALPPMLTCYTSTIFGPLPLWAMVAKTDRTLFLNLVHSLSSSSLLEHLAKAAAPRAARAAAAASRAAAATASAAAGAAVDGSAAAAAYDMAAAPSASVSPRQVSSSGVPHSALQDVLINVLDMLLPGDGPPAPVRGLLSGPCLQYFAAAQAVSQLHAADGGPLYGLPYDALMPPMPADKAAVEPASSEEGQQRQQEQQQEQQQQQVRQPSPRISTRCVECSIAFWKACINQEAPVPLGPLRRRHLVALCLRAARVALDSMDMRQGGLHGHAAGGEGTGGAGEGGQAGAGAGAGAREPATAARRAAGAGSPGAAAGAAAAAAAGAAGA